jgi:arsenate reductase
MDKARDIGSITLYGIRNCDTMKRAFAWLDGNRVSYAFHDYKASGVDAGKLEDWIGKTGWEALLNTRGTTWRKLTPAEQADLDERKAVKLMREYPSLIKRPIIEKGNLLLIGYDEARYAALKNA